MPGVLPYLPLPEDLSAAHQIVIRFYQNASSRRYGSRSGQIEVTCNCCRSEAPIEVRSRWTTPEALTAWRDYHQQRGIGMEG